MKRFTCLLILILLSLYAPFALAGSPASQFGFHGWPYRQPTSCDAFATAQPPRQEAAQTPVPAATARPTSRPAAQPTIQPTARPEKTPAASRGDYTTSSAIMQEQKLWNLLNQDRANQGLPALPLDGELSRLARMKSCDMRDNHYFAHTSPTYGSAAQMLTTYGYAFRGVGENIAHHATVEKAEAAFMSSSGHRTNILGRQWTKVGIGVCVDANGFIYATQLFAR